MDKTSRPEHLVTDHAVVRYVERILGIDIRREVLDAILGDGRAEMVRQLGSGDIRIGKTNAVLRVRFGQVVTVICNDSRGGHKPERHKARRKP